MLPPLLDVAAAPTRTTRATRPGGGPARRNRSASHQRSAARRLSCSCSNLAIQAVCSEPYSSGSDRSARSSASERMPTMDRASLAALLQPLQRELADRLQHPVPGLAVERLLLPQQALLDQRLDAVQDHQVERRQRDRRGARARRIAGTDRLGGLQGAAPEDGQPPEQRLLVRRQQVVAPGDGVAQGPLAGRQVARAAGQQRQPALHPLEHRPRRQRPDAGGGQLDRQRQPVQPLADLGDGRRRSRRSARSPARAAWARSTNRRTASNWARCSGRGRSPAVRQGQRRHRILALAVDAQDGPAGDQDLQARAPTPSSSATAGAASTTCSKLSSTSSSCFWRSASRERGQRSTGRRPRARRAPGRSSTAPGPDRDRRGQRDEEDAVRKAVQHVGGDLERQARLAGAARPGQRDQAGVRAQQRRPDRLELLLPPDERRRLHRQVVRDRGQRSERREVGRQVRADELVDPLRCARGRAGGARRGP